MRKLLCTIFHSQQHASIVYFASSLENCKSGSVLVFVRFDYTPRVCTDVRYFFHGSRERYRFDDNNNTTERFQHVQITMYHFLRDDYTVPRAVSSASRFLFSDRSLESPQRSCAAFVVFPLVHRVADDTS